MPSGEPREADGPHEHEHVAAQPHDGADEAGQRRPHVARDAAPAGAAAPHAHPLSTRVQKQQEREGVGKGARRIE